MIRKIIIIGVIAIAAYFFYKKFIAPSAETFFKENMGKVDFLGVTAPTFDAIPKIEDGNR